MHSKQDVLASLIGLVNDQVWPCFHSAMRFMFIFMLSWGCVDCLRLQVAECSYYSWALGPNVGIMHGHARVSTADGGSLSPPVAP